MATVVGTLLLPGLGPYVGTVRFVPLDTPSLGPDGAGVVVGTSDTVTTDENGAFEIELACGRYRVVANTQQFLIGVPSGEAEYNIRQIITGGVSGAIIPESDAIGPATATTAGIVKTNTTDPDPVVYLKSEVDTLLGQQPDTMETALADKQPFIGAVKLYNPTTGLYHAVYLEGDEGQTHLAFGPGEAHP